MGQKDILLNNDMIFRIELTEKGAKLTLIDNSDKEIIRESEITEDDLFQLLREAL